MNPEKAKLAWTGMQSFATGICVILLLMFIGGRAVRIYGWTVTALITPASMLIIGFPFMLLFTLRKYTSFDVGFTVLSFIGLTFVVLCKSLKYSFFDPTKEMAYIPLDATLKSQGKAAVDVVGARLGKSGSCALQMILLFAFNTTEVDGYILYLTILLLVALLTWFFSAIALGKKFDALTAPNKEQIALAKA